jgi:hypothetical protein
LFSKLKLHCLYKILKLFFCKNVGLVELYQILFARVEDGYHAFRLLKLKFPIPHLMRAMVLRHIAYSVKKCEETSQKVK